MFIGQIDRCGLEGDASVLLGIMGTDDCFEHQIRGKLLVGSGRWLRAFQAEHENSGRAETHFYNLFDYNSNQPTRCRIFISGVVSIVGVVWSICLILGWY